VDGDAYQSEWKQQQPYKWIENQREQRYGPAEDEKKAPEQEG